MSLHKKKNPLDIAISFLLYFSCLFLIFCVSFTLTYIPKKLNHFYEVNPFRKMILNTDNLQVIISQKINIERLIESYDFSYLTERDEVSQKPDTIRIPVLLYHHINKVPASQGERVLNVTPENFKQQMAYLKVKGYKTLSPEEFYLYLSKGKNPETKSVLITFDDGYLDTYTNAFPILKEFGFKATFFIPPNKSEISPEKLREMAIDGMSIASHTMDHRSLGNTTSISEWIKQIDKSKQRIEEVSKNDDMVFAYPYCVYNKQSLGYIIKSNYKLAFRCGSTSGTSIDHKFQNRYELYRSWIYNNMQSFADRIKGYEYKPQDDASQADPNFHIKAL